MLRTLPPIVLILRVILRCFCFGGGGLSLASWQDSCCSFQQTFHWALPSHTVEGPQRASRHLLLLTVAYLQTIPPFPPRVLYYQTCKHHPIEDKYHPDTAPVESLREQSEPQQSCECTGLNLGAPRRFVLLACSWAHPRPSPTVGELWEVGEGWVERQVRRAARTQPKGGTGNKLRALQGIQPIALPLPAPPN